MAQVDADPLAAVGGRRLRQLKCVSPKMWEEIKKVKKAIT